MPNFDTGHYFLTTLAPIKTGRTFDERGVLVSHEQDIRSNLALLPTALQSPATEKIGINSPFSRNNRTHLCRYMVLDGAVYNGRPYQDALVATIKKVNPATTKPVDRLNCSYLLFSVDFDAVLNDGDPLPAKLSVAEQDQVRDSYARKLWETMEPELCEIYSNCVGFDEVTDANGFANYLRRCQVETTMPFNDYWLDPPKLHDLSSGLIGLLIGLPLLIVLASAVFWAFGMSSLPLLGWSLGWSFVGGLVATGIGILLSYLYVIWNGNRPMPPGKYGDLPSVLKSLYLQQTFSNFAISAQGLNDEELHKSFGEFLDKAKPDDNIAPSQNPGYISIDRENAVSE
jgi:hypothetical protein